MQLLHISDLHVTNKEESLNNVWASALPRLKDRLFDFIVVSGDLSCDGKDYKETRIFAEKTLMKHLRKKARNRIIFVPGNHDVNWSVMNDISDKLDLIGKDKIKPIIKQCKKEPFKTPYRLNMNDLGENELYKINEKIYNNRFSHMQKFLDKFYKKTSAKTPQLKHFNLEAKTSGTDWSAHIFKKEKIAFFGFNSCFRNDKYWTGSRICFDSIDRASKYADRHAKNCQLVAVWHHGLQGTEYRPDCLGYSDIGRLYNAGFRIGIHGHIHQSHIQEISELLEDRFLVIATGSLGAGHSDRPGSVGNQFSTIYLSPGYAEVNTYEREEKTHQIKNIVSEDFSFRKYDNRTVSHKVATHTRTYETGPEGITKVSVILENFENPSGAALALLAPPFCNYDFDETAKAGRDNPIINKYVIADDKICFYITTDKNSLDKVKWSYRFSNGIALSKSDIRFRKNTRRLPKVPKGNEAWPYTVRFLTKKLIINIKYPSDEFINKNIIKPFAEREIKKYGTSEWTYDPDESNRCKIIKDFKNSTISLHIDSPQIDCRYSITYKLKPIGNVVSNHHSTISNLILNLCRNNIFAPDSYCNAISKAVVNTLNKVGDPLLSRSTLIGLLWSKEKNALLPAFGCFPSRLWSLHFQYGDGVAGHCFRFNKISRWTSDQKSIIYKPYFENSRIKQAGGWIICSPLYINKKGPSIGVFSIEDNGTDKTKATKLLSLIESARAKNKDAQSFFDKIETALNAAFWKTLLELDILHEYPNYIMAAKRILNQFLRKS